MIGFISLQTGDAENKTAVEAENLSIVEVCSDFSELSDSESGETVAASGSCTWSPGDVCMRYSEWFTNRVWVSDDDEEDDDCTGTEPCEN